MGRPSDQRTALRRSLLTELIRHERIQTTEAKARAIRGDAEKLITLAKKGLRAGGAQAVHARRLAAARLNDPAMVKKLFDTIAPRYENRPGGYTRMYKLGFRQGDAAQMALLELVEE